MKEFLNRSIGEHRSALNAGEYSAVELTRACLERISAERETVGAFLSVDVSGALVAAEASDQRRRCGEQIGLLDGIPFSLKDNISAKGLPLTCASAMLEDYRSPYDATVTTRLKQAGAILLGKNNMDEFAMGSSCEYSALGVTRNPYDPERVPGGSSGGSAAAVAAGEAVFSLGTDTGGSVRQPAAFCGVYGLKPTYGAISRYGVAAMASSMDAVGIFTRTAEDCSLVFDLLRGKDCLDATSADGCYDSTDLEEHPLRIAVVSSLMGDGVAPEVQNGLQVVTDCFKEEGAVFGEAELPVPKQAMAAYSVLSCAEAASNLARYDGVRFGHRSTRSGKLSDLYANSRGEGFGKEVKRRILFGTDMLQTENRERYYLGAQRVRRMICEQMEALLMQYDLLLTPTTPTTAFQLGSVRSPEELYRADMCTVYANLSGFPALSIPVGMDDNGLPLAVQLTARPFAEKFLLKTAKRLESMLNLSAVATGGKKGSQ